MGFTNETDSVKAEKFIGFIVKGMGNMITLYITRHGETVWNIEKRMQGSQDSPLTAKGIQNALSLGKALKNIQFTAILSSPSGRTVHTANLIKGERKLPVIFDDNLKEIDMGDWEGKTQTAIEAAFPLEYDAFWNAPHLYTPVGGETFTQVRERAQQFLNHIKREYQSGNILVVTHSVVIKCLFSIFMNAPLERIWDPPFIHDTSLTIAEMNENGFKIVLAGDLSHRETRV